MLHSSTQVLLLLHVWWIANHLQESVTCSVSVCKRCTFNVMEALASYYRLELTANDKQQIIYIFKYQAECTCTIYIMHPVLS